jgi:hypothetical protein
VQYNVEGEFNTLGCSGAPVIDEWGQFAGINIEHLNDQNIAGKRQLVCVDATDMLRVVKVPAGVRPVIAATRPSTMEAPRAQASDDAVDSPAKSADAALRLAQLYITNQMYDKARVKLQAVIDDYPGTDAAKKAQDLLSQLPAGN